MMRRFLLIVLVLFLFNCDTRKGNSPEEVRSQILCYTAGICPSQRGVKFGILGDSWTDLLLGVPVIETLRVQLEKYYGYKMTGATLGGQTMKRIYDTGTHIQVIDQAGPDLKYMLLSLGGNDIQGNPSSFAGRVEEEKQERFALVQNTLLNMIRTGNLYKVQKYGGAPLLWIIYGYDYTNPDIPSFEGSTGCRDTLLAAGLNNTEINSLSVTGLVEYNQLLRNLTAVEPQLRYIDLLGTLGGAPSQPGHMFDCIHPNTGGFSILARRYVTVLEGYTNYEK